MTKVVPPGPVQIPVARPQARAAVQGEGTLDVRLLRLPGVGVRPTQVAPVAVRAVAAAATPAAPTRAQVAPRVPISPRACVRLVAVALTVGTAPPNAGVRPPRAPSIVSAIPAPISVPVTTETTPTAGSGAVRGVLPTASPTPPAMAVVMATVGSQPPWAVVGIPLTPASLPYVAASGARGASPLAFDASGAAPLGRAALIPRRPATVIAAAVPRARAG